MKTFKEWLILKENDEYDWPEDPTGIANHFIEFIGELNGPPLNDDDMPKAKEMYSIGRKKLDSISSRNPSSDKMVQMAIKSMYQIAQEYGIISPKKGLFNRGANED